ncbi:DUF1127 domain-containing protein [Rhizobium leguminosarum bv. viciae]|nr:DUF1127 domain-containing protein [Rhizobium leguminosarum bv. viciae]
MKSIDGRSMRRIATLMDACISLSRSGLNDTRILTDPPSRRSKRMLVSTETLAPVSEIAAARIATIVQPPPAASRRIVRNQPGNTKMTSHHASTTISGFGSNGRSAGLLHTIASHIRAHIGRQRLLREQDRIRSELLSLPDNLLKDIGLSRDQIRYADGGRAGFDGQIVMTGTANEGKADQRAAAGDLRNSFDTRTCKTVMP